jgi:hypothetical protein
MRLAFVVIAGLALAGSAAAQDRFLLAGAPGPDGPPDPLMFFSVEDGFEMSVVKGQPYQAEAVTEIVHHLADGNTIKRKLTSQVYRDSDGRTRRESSFAGLGTFAPAEGHGRNVFVSDPGAGVAYVLDEESKTARKLPRPPRSGGPAGTGDTMFFRHAGPMGGKDMGAKFKKRLPEPTKESLGNQTLEGVEAEGTRTTITIPAGDIGNEKPIQMVSERWYSPELKAVVLSKHSDPRMGETTYRLTNINRGEPDRSLFEVPADYTVKDAPFRSRDKDKAPQL